MAESKTATKPATAPAAATTGTTESTRIAPVIFGARADIPMPTRKSNRGGKNVYPFDTLTAAGMSFGVNNKTAKQLSTVVSNQNKKHKTQVLDANQKPVDSWTAKFFVVDVDAKSDPEGATARVFREI
jgi:hypothetical protein